MAQKTKLEWKQMTPWSWMAKIPGSEAPYLSVRRPRLLKDREACNGFEWWIDCPRVWHGARYSSPELAMRACEKKALRFARETIDALTEHK